MTTPLTIEEFRARFDAFCTLSDAKVQAMIEDTQCNFDIQKWGCNYKRAHSLYVAHFLALGTLRSKGNTSPILQGISKSADGLSVSYSSNSSSNNSHEFLKTTNYGQEYLMLLEKSRVPGAVVIKRNICLS